MFVVVFMRTKVCCFRWPVVCAGRAPSKKPKPNLELLDGAPLELRIASSKPKQQKRKKSEEEGDSEESEDSGFDFGSDDDTPRPKWDRVRASSFPLSVLVRLQPTFV